MKTKILAGSYLFILIVGTLLSLYIPKNDVVANDAVVIPKEAIRLRILANSDSEKDQEIKQKVRDEVNLAITAWVEELTSLEEARNTIKGNLPEIEEIAERVLKEYGSTDSIKVDFSKVQFPTKLYGEFLYPAGIYEAVLITIGEGKGANWWCVLFPPLCFVDISNGIATSTGFEDNQTEEAGESKEKEQVALAESNEDKGEPVYVEEKEEEVEFKFFIVDFFKSIF